jgi:hypothetical protein
VVVAAVDRRFDNNSDNSFGQVIGRGNWLTVWRMTEEPLWGEALRVDEAIGQRWKAALEILAEGGYILWREIGLTFRSQVGAGPSKVGTTLYVRVGSAWQTDSITPGRAEAELRGAQDEIANLAHNSADFADLIAGHPISYELLYDYGTGAVRLATWTSTGFQYRWK